ncbi:chromate transporter [Anseongella ginsenosidimutans]|uniref:Chromate transporter n=1 Tax=Anseongella ginsenosidimutans TaxID=496056 RepID=A0A4R3KSP0_9SPHI|nr:chromate efflux transporter [Anseongella ginsenosidimutans]TCS88228.1 chromate transporter [Anseongella ginsenosidimutans]
MFFFTLTAFGGAQAHLAMMLKIFVKNRKYLTEEELLELNALCAVLPGPSSTQTLAAIAYKRGGAGLAVLSSLIWLLPPAIIMAGAAILVSRLSPEIGFTRIFRFIEPMAVGFVCYAAVLLAQKVIRTRFSIIVAAVAALTTVIFKSPYLFPLLIIGGGVLSSLLHRNREERELEETLILNINRKKVAAFFGILVLFALMGALINRSSFFSLPVRLFENFYRNGALIFGGGQVLVPLLYTEFVELKGYLTSQDFLSGFALQQIVPGPTFSFTSYVGGMALKNQGTSGQLLGSLVAMIGINLPGLILILFIVPFWENLKKITRIKNAMMGVNAVAVGLMLAAAVIMFEPIAVGWLPVGLALITFVLLSLTRVPAPVLFIAGILLGVFL